MIDVVIVAKNESRHLGSVLSALSAQESCSAPINVYVVDNGSTDDTVAIATSHGATVIHCRGSLGKARNAGIKSGTGEFVAFLDGHSVPSSSWACSFIESFNNHPNLGGLMGSIENRCEHKSAQFFARESIFSSPHKLWHSTASGLSSTLPWIPTGNCMYSRRALQEVGLFSEELFRCEDTDLSWKIVLRGYQLSYVPAAHVTHFDQATPLGYLRKYFDYGAGAAELAARYGLRSNPNKLTVVRFSQLILDCCYQFGYKSNSNSLPATSISVNESFRQPFTWSANNIFALSRHAIFWFVDDNEAICVQLKANVRIVLKDTSLLLFRLMVDHCDRSIAVEKLRSKYEISEAEAAEDIDQFVRQLLDEEILVPVSSTEASRAAGTEQARA